MLTTISSADIIVISASDITNTEIVAERMKTKDMPNAALTEAVFYILLSLTTPMHGYGIMQNVEKLSNGRIKLAAGTLYGAISTLLERGWISALSGEKDSRKKEYLITQQGRQALMQELLRLGELVDNGKRILEGRYI